ncbi:Uncharacterised protein [Mycobacterium tuberculosis]|nr:Uncharacterised protein [Mycobacterium tuberculosis]COY86994.1 Uncharacterised protein [Mycobacterium tuberculosis]
MLLVVVDHKVVQPGVRKVGLVVPQSDQIAIKPVQPGVFAGAGFGPVQLAALECLRVLRVRNVVRGPAMFGELLLASCHGAMGQFRFGM